MTVGTAQPQQSAYDEWRDRHWRLTGLGFALMWLAVGAAVLGNGETRSQLETLLAAGVWLGTLLLAVSGPEPWRATRWAWGWFILFGGPLGAVAYLVLGGSLGVARPREPTRRLTGGWALLIAVVLLGGPTSP